MSEKDTFGLRLRAARERQGISLEAIARRTKVSVALWEAMERNDFSRWPWGLFARAYMRDYATIVGLDPAETVNEFCRWFPNGDRRRGNLVRAQAEIIDIRSQFQEEELPPEGDRRAPPPEPRPKPWALPGGQRGRRLVGAAADLLFVCAVAMAAWRLLATDLLGTLGVIAVAYHSVGGALVGRSPGIALAEHLNRRVPQLVAVPERRIHA